MFAGHCPQVAEDRLPVGGVERLERLASPRGSGCSLEFDGGGLTVHIRKTREPCHFGHRCHLLLVGTPTGMVRIVVARPGAALIISITGLQILRTKGGSRPVVSPQTTPNCRHRRSGRDRNPAWHRTTGATGRLGKSPATMRPRPVNGRTGPLSARCGARLRAARGARSRCMGSRAVTRRRRRGN